MSERGQLYCQLTDLQTLRRGEHPQQRAGLVFNEEWKMQLFMSALKMAISEEHWRGRKTGSGFTDTGFLYAFFSQGDLVKQVTCL